MKLKVPLKSHYIPPLVFFFSFLLFAKSNCEDTFIPKFFFKTLCLEIVSFHSRKSLQLQSHEGGKRPQGEETWEGRVRPVRPRGLPRGTRELCPLPPSSLSLLSRQCHSDVCQCVLINRLNVTREQGSLGSRLAGEDLTLTGHAQPTPRPRGCRRHGELFLWAIPVGLLSSALCCFA